jgi:hypothetical protein
MAQSIIQWANVRVEVEKELFIIAGKFSSLRPC